MFYVGQKVVCVDDSCGWKMQDVKPFILNNIYTIEDVKLHDTWDAGEVLEVKVENSPYWADSKRFRPLVGTKQEVSFTIGASPDSEQWDNRKVKVK